MVLEVGSWPWATAATQEDLGRPQQDKSEGGASLSHLLRMCKRCSRGLLSVSQNTDSSTPFREQEPNSWSDSCTARRSKHLAQGKN